MQRVGRVAGVKGLHRTSGDIQSRLFADEKVFTGDVTRHVGRYSYTGVC